MTDGLKETEVGERDRTEADLDIKTEDKDGPEMKREVVAGVSARSEGPYTTDGCDSEYYDAQEAYDSEYDAEYEQGEVVKSERKPSGFIYRNTVPEVRRSDRSAFGWSWSAQLEREWRRRSVWWLLSGNGCQDPGVYEVCESPSPEWC
ncbi:hypothetical protein GN244_ATG01249 [Phytophthora infestans]|uniref:Uncharacterized protein n=1 Tax=Phytophthora infestans TaxID=4787 RepID=A0A833TGE5_PHYIN|nr:hypothetical protein GN244_ATG01249 [Phytophthora infestans]